MVTNIKITSDLKTTNILMLITKPIKHKMPHVTHHFKATYVSGLPYSTQTFNIALFYTKSLAHKMKMAII